MIDLPYPLYFLMTPKRYKVARGGRGSSKSWSFARTLLILGSKSRLRILCAREVQRSIKDSVHKLLSDQIQLMGLGGFYTVFENIIKGANGTEIIFSGLAEQTAESIKSYEGIDICWVEEAQVVTKRSWDILTPTIRKPDGCGGNGAEIWVTFNPDLETDETYQRFVVHKSDDCISVEINWRDNPWWNDLLEKERLDCLKRDPENYDNIWEGKPRPAVEGAIFHKEIVQAYSEGRVRNVPYDPMLKVHVVFDLGRGGNMFCGLVQKIVSEIRIIYSVSDDDLRHLADYSAHLREFKYNWGRVWLPHDGFAIDDKGLSSAMILRKLGWDVVPKDEISILGVEEGIKVAKMTFPRVYIDETRNAFLLECLKRYRRRINRETKQPGTPMKDGYDHGGDFFRYMSVNVDYMTNDEKEKPFEAIMPHMEPLDDVVGI